MQEIPEQRAGTGYRVLSVKKETKERLDQIMREVNIKRADDIISLLIEHYIASKTADQQQKIDRADSIEE